MFVHGNSTAFSTGPTSQVRDPNKRTSEKIEPSKVVVFPDSAVRGTDTSNMQIKEFHPKNGKGKWLAVHIPDHMSYPRKNVKIIASKNVAKELQQVVGPNKDTLAKEIQSILGVNEQTLQRMIAEGQQNDEDKEDDDEDGEDDDDNEDADDIEGNDNDDDESNDDNPGNEDYSDDKTSDMCDSKTTVDKKLCQTLQKIKKKVKDGSGEDIGLEEDERPKIHVEQPEGFELRWEDILNNFKHFSLKRRKKICRIFGLHNRRCRRAKQRKRGFKRKLKKYLLRMLRKFLKSNKNEFEDYLSKKLKDALAGRLQPADDGLLHIYSKNSGNMNMEDFLKDLNDGTPPRPGVNYQASSQSSAGQDPLTMDDNTVDGNVFRVTPQMNKLAGDEGQDAPSDAVSALNNIIHPLLNDQDNKIDEKLQTKILQEELGKIYISHWEY